MFCAVELDLRAVVDEAIFVSMLLWRVDAELPNLFVGVRIFSLERVWLVSCASSFERLINCSTRSLRSLTTPPDTPDASCIDGTASSSESRRVEGLRALNTFGNEFADSTSECVSEMSDLRVPALPWDS